jgi:hypothetical protein
MPTGKAAASLYACHERFDGPAVELSKLSRRRLLSMQKSDFFGQGSAVDIYELERNAAIKFTQSA